MHEATTIPTLTSDTSENLTAAALRAESWFGEPFLAPDEDPLQALAPGTARRAALDDALAEIDAGLASPSARWKVRYGLMLGLERVLTEDPARTAAGTELRRHQIDALTGMLAELIASTQRSVEENGNGNGSANGAVAEAEVDDEADDDYDAGFVDDELIEEEFVGTDPGAIRRYRFRHPDGVREDDRRRGLRRGRPASRCPHPDPPSPSRRAVQARPHDRGLRRSLRGSDPGRLEAAERVAAHDPDVRMVRSPRLGARSQGVPPRHLRRGAHGARGEDERGDPRLPRAPVHRDDRDRAAHREAGLGRLPRLGRRPPARRCRPTRPHRATSLPARPARGGDQLRADRRRRLRGARTRRCPRPRGPEPGGGEPLPRALRIHARDRLRGRRRARLQPRAGVPSRGTEGRSGVGANAARAPGRDARGVRARRDQRPRQRAAPRRGLELAPRDHLHAPRPDRLAPRLPAAHRPDHAHPSQERGRRRRRLRAQGRDALGACRFAARAARLRLLPRGRARHSRAASPPAAPRSPEALTGAVARPRDPRRRTPAERDPARVAAHRPEVPRRRRAALLGDDRRAADSLRPAGRVREEVRGRAARTRERSSSSSPRALRRTPTAACA